MGWKFGKAGYGKLSKIKKGIRVHETNLEEKKVIDFICQARDGKSKKMLNIKLKKINSDFPPIHFWDVDGMEIDEFSKPSTLTFKEISDLLNQYEITKRDKQWSACSVKRVYDFRNKIKIKNLEDLKI